MKFKTSYTKLLSDVFTPVELYLKIRDRYQNSFLLESSDYKSKENSFSYICFDPIAEFKATTDKLSIKYPNSEALVKNISDIDVSDELLHFLNEFESEDLDLNFTTNGIFGYTSYDAIPLFEDIKFKRTSIEIPLIQYHLFRNIIVFNHFNSELYIFQNSLKGEESNLEELKTLIFNRSIPEFSFEKVEGEYSNMSDMEFIDNLSIKRVFW